jgi:hypothetical protein
MVKSNVKKAGYHNKLEHADTRKRNLSPGDSSEEPIEEEERVTLARSILKT